MTPQIKQRIEQIRRGEIPEGYKKTKVGIVPEEWEEGFLGNYIQEYKELSNDIEKYPVYSSSRQGLIPQSLYFDNREAVETNLGYKIVPNGYVTYRHMSDDDLFHFNVNNTGGEILVSSEYPVFSSTKKSSLGYIIPMLNDTARFRYFCRTQKMGGTRTRLYYKNLCNYKSVFPPLAEQEKIVEILQAQDKLIELQQKKIDELKRLKKGYLSKMFPKKGCNVPEIRFPGFTDPWEQRKVGDLLIERNQQAPMSDEYPLMAFIANEGVAPKGERYDRSALVTDTVNKLYKKTEKGDFIYSSNNLETGSIGLNKYGKACISPVYSIFEPTGIADSDFLGRRLVRKDFINAMVKWRQGVIYGQWRIHESDFLKIEITVPSVEEQRKIGTYLDQLDHLITLHQRKCDEEKQKKKALMQLLLTGIVRVEEKQ